MKMALRVELFTQICTFFWFKFDNRKNTLLETFFSQYLGKQSVFNNSNIKIEKIKTIQLL